MPKKRKNQKRKSTTNARKSSIRLGPNLTGRILMSQRGPVRLVVTSVPRDPPDVKKLAQVLVAMTKRMSQSDEDSAKEDKKRHVV